MVKRLDTLARRTWRGIRVAACALALCPAAHAAPSHQIDRPRIALGEALTLTLNAKSGALESLDLTPLTADFEIHARTLTRSEREDSLALTLYPLRPGHLVLPRLGLTGRPIAVDVAEQSDTAPRVRLRMETDPAAPFARQPARLTLEACDDGSLDWKRPVLPIREGFILRPLGEQQMTVERDGERCTAHRWHWSLLPTVAGALDPRPPMLEAGKFGQRLRFPPPEITLDVRPVPDWLPAEVAVGKPRIRAAPLPASWIVNRPLAWRMEIEGGYGVDSIKHLLALELAGHPGFSAYPPSVEMLPPERADAAMPRLAVTLYVVPGQSGILSMPNLALPWFDPATGRLETLALPGPSLEIVNPFYTTLARAGLSALAMGMLAMLSLRLLRAARWRLARQRELRRIAEAGDIAALTRAVRGFSLAPATPAAATLGAWRARQVPGPALEALIARLESAAYGVRQADTNALKRETLRVLGQLRPND